MGQEEVASSPVGPPVWRRGQSKGQNNIRAGSDIAGRSSQGTGHVAQWGPPVWRRGQTEDRITSERGLILLGHCYLGNNLGAGSKG